MDNGIPEYRKIRDRDVFQETQFAVQDNLRDTKWSCPSCGIPYSQKLGLITHCEDCGTRLEIE